MAEYLNFWRAYADFSGRTTRRGFWMAILWHYIISFFVLILLMIVLPIVLMAALSMEPEAAVQAFKIGYSFYTLTWIVPFFAIMTRRLRDAGYSAKSFFWLLIPVIGEIAIIVRLCTASKQAEESSQ